MFSLFIYLFKETKKFNEIEEQFLHRFRNYGFYLCLSSQDQLDKIDNTAIDKVKSLITLRFPDDQCML